MNSAKDIARFRKIVWRNYRTHQRQMPWRETQDPYAIFVSEVMLQQTQVNRVIEKYHEFVAQFPDFASLAAASPASVIRAWQGLGYNRRALFLQKAASQIIQSYGGILPRDVVALESLPGIGRATARSTAAFAFNEPTVFIETNIRRVFIHHFFSDREAVNDADLMPLIAAALPAHRARRWYWALMDYGAYLARAVANPNRRSRHYVRHDNFEGSRRQLRGQILRLVSREEIDNKALVQSIGPTNYSINEVVQQLIIEGFIVQRRGRLALKR